MRRFHMISAKRKGWEQMYDYYPFPTDKYTREAALSAFNQVTKQTLKNDKYYDYTSYEIDGNEYYSIEYSGEFDESSLISDGYSKDELDYL